MSKPKEPSYLGDSVYIGPWEDGGLQITTDSHRPHEAQNVIYLEPSIVKALVEYSQEWLKELNGGA